MNKLLSSIFIVLCLLRTLYVKNNNGGKWPSRRAKLGALGGRAAFLRSALKGAQQIIYYGFDCVEDRMTIFLGFVSMGTTHKILKNGPCLRTCWGLFSQKTITVKT